MKTITNYIITIAVIIITVLSVITAYSTRGYFAFGGEFLIPVIATTIYFHTKK